jgi:hypothetical protein
VKTESHSPCLQPAAASGGVSLLPALLLAKNHSWSLLDLIVRAWERPLGLHPPRLPEHPTRPPFRDPEQPVLSKCSTMSCATIFTRLSAPTMASSWAYMVLSFSLDSTSSPSVASSKSGSIIGRPAASSASLASGLSQ